MGPSRAVWRLSTEPPQTTADGFLNFVDLPFHPNVTRGCYVKVDPEGWLGRRLRDTFIVP
jgi:hypothetical protein